MSTLVDTPVWSELLRRNSPNAGVTQALSRLINEGEALIIGPIRQEILSGVKDRSIFDSLAKGLSAFPDEGLLTADFENAALMYNECRARGIQGSNTDFLICAVAVRMNYPIFTLDRDFVKFSLFLPIQLVEIDLPG